MRSYFIVAVAITVVIISISSLAVEGRIGDSGVQILRRMLQDDKATIADQAEADDTCKDSTPLPIPIGVNENLNCKKIKKAELCEKEYDGKYLYESCEKSCEICEDEYDTTEAPTGDLLDMVFDELGDPLLDPSSIQVDEEGNVIHGVSESEAPTLTPIAPLTDAPTEAPSAYPTESPTTLAPTVIALLSVSEEPTSEKLLELDFLTLSENVHDDLFQNEFHQGEDAVSTAPTQSPIAPFTDAPTESPSAYPTTPPTVNEFGDGGIFEGLDDDELLATLEGI